MTHLLRACFRIIIGLQIYADLLSIIILGFTICLKSQTNVSLPKPVCQPFVI